MTTIKSLPPPEYAEEEKDALIDFVLALKKTHIQEFFRRVNLQRSGTKTDLRERLQEALDAGDMSYERAVDFLDSIAPWGKQHVFLYSGPRGDLRSWKDPDLLMQHLKQHRVGKYFNARCIGPPILGFCSEARNWQSLTMLRVLDGLYFSRIKSGVYCGLYGQRCSRLTQMLSVFPLPPF